MRLSGLSLIEGRDGESLKFRTQGRRWQRNLGFSARAFYDAGSLNMSLVVITPHASIIYFSDRALDFIALNPNASNDTLIDPNNAEETYASILPYVPLTPHGNNYLSLS